MTTNDEQLMKKHSITREVKYTFIHENCEYQSLEQAVNSAISKKQEVEDGTPVYWDTEKEL